MVFEKQTAQEKLDDTVVEVHRLRDRPRTCTLQGLTESVRALRARCWH